MSTPLSKSYEPGDVERDIRICWESAGIFRADPLSDRPPFCMVIPPPNVTGSLHMGHALNNTLQDILARYKRMDGYEVLWLPGTDHAGIATQNVVEREIARENVSRQHLGREKFLKRVWQWKETYGGRILEQLKRLGCSCDFSRTRFTMDDGLSAAVREVFVQLWEEKLLYRGDYIVNWCPRCGTALSDIEVQYKEIDGAFYHIRYPFVFGSDGVVVATTRPETMLGDTAVAAHTEDARHASLIGRNLRLPIIGREIPIIADTYVDPSFGTGLVKITPAHDPNDFLIGRRHNLPLVNILNPDATLNANAGPYAGQDRFEARKAIVARLDAEGFLVKVEPYRHNVGHCYRCATPIEPYVSKQWFIKMKPLAEPAIAAVKEGRIRLYPDRWVNDYLQWMENIRDWCVSRQIWWGHRIPAWYCTSCMEEEGEGMKGVIVARSAPKECPQCGSADLKQDDDVLDTWFSSALWPFSTLGWPDRTPELKKFYPTNVLSTGFDILTFWVSRMIVMGLHVMKDIPFRDVPIHALVRTQTGEKMSKSKGNVIDPLVMMDKYGTDAVRFTLAALAAQGRDIKLSEQRFEGYRHFANKLWNASRFVLMNVGDGRVSASGAPSADVSDIGRVSVSDAPSADVSDIGRVSASGAPSADVSDIGRVSASASGVGRAPSAGASGDGRLADLANGWILGRLNDTVAGVRNSLDKYEFDAAARRLYDFIWGEYCDWYIEISKIFLTENDPVAKSETSACLAHVLTQCLKLLHPYMPFVTEEIWSKLPVSLRGAESNLHLAVSGFPKPSSPPAGDAEPADRLSTAIEMIRQIRNIRTLYRIPPNSMLSTIVYSVPSAGVSDSDPTSAGSGWIADTFPLFVRLAKTTCRLEAGAVPPVKSAAACFIPPFTLHIQIGDVVDIDAERRRIRARLGEIDALIEKNEKRLKDPEFLGNAPDEVIETMREKTGTLRLEKEQMVRHLA